MISLGLGPYLDNQFACLPLSTQIFLASVIVLGGFVGCFWLSVYVLVTEVFHIPFRKFLDDLCGVDSE
ncbi:hypothetical protein V7O62_12285 [Methanolobus sp. ZRKC2]|uniref:hypothetical protein n=1 Tax=Methanolobus sp. ZRKC2 TaxID=3125783 RepID=UPI00325369B2